MSTGAALQIRLSPGRVATLTAALAALNLLLLAATAAAEALGPDAPWRLRLLARQLHFAYENNAAAWYSSMLLLGAALAAVLCFAVDARAGQGRRSRALDLGWLVMAALFAGMSLDELGSLHERVNDLLRFGEVVDLLRVAAPGWVGALAVPLASVCAALLAFGWVRVRRSRLAFALIAAGTLLFASVPLQEVLELQHRAVSSRRPVGALLLEEGSELFGALCMLAGAAWFACVRARAADGAAGFAEARFDARSAAVLVTALGVGMVAVASTLPHVVNLQDGRGVPLHWFPAALGLVVALAAAARAADERARGAAVGLWLLAGLHLGLSIDHGSAHRFTEELLRGTPALRGMIDATLGVAVVAAALLSGRRSPGRGMRAALAAWAVLLLIAFLVDGGRPWLGFAAYGLLLPVLAGPARAGVRPSALPRWSSAASGRSVTPGGG